MGPDANNGGPVDPQKIPSHLKFRYGWPFPPMSDPPPLGFRIKSGFVVPMVGTFSKILMGWCNTIQGENIDGLVHYVSNRPKGVPLITVSNHYSCVDDPGLWGVLRWRDLWNARIMRWSPAAHDIAFTRRIYCWFFAHGKCVPIIRGLGVYQEAMDFLIARLGEGSWVHIFPEGKVNMTQSNMRFKWGVGRLVYESPITPIVLPFYHIGMDVVLPNRPPYIPRVGRVVTMVVGEPLDFREVVRECRESGKGDEHARKTITDIIQQNMNVLRQRAEKIHYNNS